MKRSVLIILDILFIGAIIFSFVRIQKPADNVHIRFDGDTSKSTYKDPDGVIAELYKGDESVQNAIQETSAKLGMNIYVYIAGKNDASRSDGDIEIFAMDGYDERFGENSDGVYYYMDVSGKSPAYDYFTASGKAMLIYENRINDILDMACSVLPPSTQKAEPKDIANAIFAFCDALENYYTEDISPFTYHYDAEENKYIYKSGSDFVVSEHKPALATLLKAGMGAVAALITALICYAAVKHSYKFKKPQSASTYVSESKTKFLVNTDVFLRSHTSRHKIESNSGGSHSGGGHRSGGGGGRSHHGSHVGGGRHR